MDSDGSNSSSSSGSDSENETQNEPASPNSRSQSRNSPSPQNSPVRSDSQNSVHSQKSARSHSANSVHSPKSGRSNSANSIHSSKSARSNSGSPVRSRAGSVKSQRSRSRSQSRESNDSNKSAVSGRDRSPSSDRESNASNDSNKSSSGNSSDSSASSRGSKRHKSFSSNVSAAPDTQPEEISDGEMELEAPKDSEDEDEKKVENIQISHEDLSDVSDLDSVNGDRSDEDEEEKAEEKKTESPVEEPNSEVTKSPPTDLRLKLDEAAKIRKELPKLTEKTSKTEDCEEALDFEAEDGECLDDSKEENGEQENVDTEEAQLVVEKKPPEDLEEGEVSDDEETRPEETEPRPVCRFYSRGQCTWGASCRFLHPGVTDKGNYTMFEMIRPVVPGPALLPGFPPEIRDDRLFGHAAVVRPEPPPAESAWERGLRTAKEMVRRAIKRKEQDMDFEEKKMNLTLSQDELDKENGYYTRAASPVVVEPVIPPPVKHYPRHDPYFPQRHPEDYYRRVHHYEPAIPPAIPVRQVRIEPEYDPPPSRERVHSYRELPTHRMPDYYNDKYEERTVTMSSKRAHRPKREVVVQRAEASGRGDEWADPWMRSKSPGGRAGARSGARRQSYSSGSSYSSSSSTRSSSVSSRSSSYRRRQRSRSRSGSVGRRRRGVSPPPAYRRDGRRRRGAVSPSVIVSERKAANERASLMNPPAPSARKPHKDTRPPSPGMMRTSAQNPPPPSKTPGTDQFGRTTKREVDRVTTERRNLDPDRKKLIMTAISDKTKATKTSKSSSGSDSSGSSSSDSESTYSSSSSSRDGPGGKRKLAENREQLALAVKTKPVDTLKGERATEVAKKRAATSPPAGDPAAKVAAVGKPAAANSNGGKKATSRREELLKQLKAVEDAIAKKRSKIN